MSKRSLGAALAAAALACGSSAPSPSSQGVIISPAHADLLVGAKLTFAATVAGDDTRVSFSVVEGATGGSVTHAGEYVAPPTPGEFHVRATTLTDPSRYTDAVVTVHGYAHALSRLPDPSSARDHHTASLLGDGTVLVAGGYGWGEGPAIEAERFDPATGGFRPGGTMRTPRMAHAAALLADGTVLLSGGWNPYLPAKQPCEPVIQGSELYDPATSQFSAGPDMHQPRRHHTMGGEVFDPASGRSFAGAEMSNLRVRATATKLASGEVLIVGGNYSGGPVLEADLYR